jgi:cob(I)alamin adenosyltransferase
MNYVKKIFGLNIIIIISCLTMISSAVADGFIFDWKLFIVDADLALKSTNREIPINNSSADDIKALISEDSRNIFPMSSDQNNISTQKPENKSLMKNVQIRIFQADTYLHTRETSTYNDDEQVSKLIKSFNSLIFDDSKTKSLESIGKIIEPQINFYLEF